MTSLPELGWGTPAGESSPFPQHYSTRSTEGLALDRERMVEDIDRVMMQTHSMRSKILNKTGQVLEKYKEEDARSTAELQELPETLDKFDRLQSRKRMRKKLKENAEAVLNELLANARTDRQGSDHALNFHLAKHNAGAGESELPLVLEEGEDDATLGTFSFYAPHASDTGTAQQSRSSTLGPKSRRAKRLFSSAPAHFGPPPPVPHEPGELERRHRCRRGVFDFLETARQEEEKIQGLIEECERSLVLAPDDTSRQEASSQRSKLHRQLTAQRKAAAEKAEDLFKDYQPRVPNTKEDGTLKALERELKLPTLEKVYKDVSDTLSDLLAADARRMSELQSLSQGAHSCQRMVFGEGDEYENEDYGEEGGEGQRYEYEEYEYEEYDDENNAYEEEGFEEENGAGGAGKGGRKVGNVMVLSSSGRQPASDNTPWAADNKASASDNHNRAAAGGKPSDKESAEDRALRLLQSDEEALLGIQDLHAVRPVTHEGQGIERGVRGKVADNTRPLGEDPQSKEAREKEEEGKEEEAQSKTIGSSYGRDVEKGTPHWTDAYWEVQRQDSQRKGLGTPGTPGDHSASSLLLTPAGNAGEVAVPGSGARAEEKGNDAEAGKGAEGEGEGEKGEGGPLSPSGALSFSGGLSTSGGLSRSLSKAETLGRDSLGDSLLEASLQRHCVLTRGAKLGDRNVLIRVYMGLDDDGGIEVSAFDPASQETYTSVLSGPEAKRLLSRRGEEVCEEVVKQAGPDIVAALQLTEPQHGQEAVLEVRLPME